MILVTGGSGLIGSFLMEALVAQGRAVRALYRNNIPPSVAAPQIEWVQGDIRDADLLHASMTGVTHVFHCAGLVSYAPQDEDALQQINVEGTAAVVDTCLQWPSVRLCHVSSVAALGGPAAAPDSPGGPIVLDEKSKWDLGAEHSAYATSKYLGELEVWRGISEGLDAVIINPSVVLGPANWERSSTRLFHYAYQQHAFYTAGSVNFVDVRDVVAMCLKLAFEPATGGQRYVLSAGAMPLHDFLVAAATCFRRKPPTTKVPNWAAEAIWRLEHARSLLTGARPLITKDTARAGRQTLLYHAEKVVRATGLSFRPLPDTIAWCCENLRSNLQASGAVVVS